GGGCSFASWSASSKSSREAAIWSSSSATVAGSGELTPASSGPRQVEPARGDDVALDLAGAAFDGVRHRAQVHVLDPALHRYLRAVGLAGELAEQAEHLHAGAIHALVQLRTVHLGHTGLVAGGHALLGLHGDDLVAHL